MSFPRRIHMVGVGGIGMSALAQLLAARGVAVSGSDRSESPTMDLLRQKGIEVTIGHGALPEGIEMLIYSDAVWPDAQERREAAEKNIPQISYFEALGSVSKDMYTIAIAGTHGKTTTTGMVASILKAAGENPTAVVGSIVRDFGSNFLPGCDDLLVAEACEYRDHLLEIDANILVITNIELDHTDFFPSLAAVQDTFRAAAERVPKDGVIITNPADPNIAAILSHASASIIDYTKETVPQLSLIGAFNAMNARAAKAAAKAYKSDVPDAVVDAALAGYKGAWRRFEFKGELESGALIYDDYGHHPTEVAKTIEAAREKFPDRNIILAFHPHLFSRTRDFMDEFAKVLATADEVILAPIFPAREKPIEGITSDVLAGKIRAFGTPAEALPSLHDIYLYFAESAKLDASTLLITMGAGDIYKVGEELTDE